MATLTETQVFYVQTCISCGVAFAMPEDFDKRLRQTHNEFYCPNGHVQYYNGESDAQRYKRLLKDEERKHAQTQFELMTERKAREETQKALTKTQKRIKGGACPCCNRQFTNLHRHMHTKHPEYAELEQRHAR